MITRNQLGKLDMNELRILRDLIQNEIANRAIEVKYELSVGTKVKINHKKTIGRIFTIVDVKRKKAVVTDANGARYNVSMPLIEIVK